MNLNWLFLSVLRVFEERLDIAMTFDDVDYLKGVFNIPKQNDVAFEGEATDVGTKFRARTSQRSGESRQLTTTLSQSSNPATADNELTAFPGDVFEDVNQICLGRWQYFEAWHLKILPCAAVRPWPQVLRLSQFH